MAEPLRTRLRRSIRRTSPLVLLTGTAAGALTVYLRWLWQSRDLLTGVLFLLTVGLGVCLAGEVIVGCIEVSPAARSRLRLLAIAAAATAAAALQAFFSPTIGFLEINVLTGTALLALGTVTVDLVARAFVQDTGQTPLPPRLVLQVGILLLLAWEFRLENPAFYRQILPLATAGFVVHHVLPFRFQTLFVGLLGMAGLLLVFGPAAGASLIAIGLGLIGLCHVPVGFRWRVALVLAAATALMALRAGWIPAPWPGAIWPILGSMFMFRLAIYLYDLKHHAAPGPGFTLAYFFLLPNVVFPLFPVIDFHTFRRTHYDRDASEIYEEGTRWILRGFVHLILYRLVYQFVATSPSAVESTAGIVQYLVGNFGLYLRVSGQFHVAVGLLHLFGFRLPETHRFFYLASSFSDLWRRINIYWKDFMQKMVYLPVFFGLKRRGETAALVGATVSVVAVTWFLHAYQWFWLLGTWLFSVTDTVFWGALGVLLVASALREQRRGRTRQLTTRAPTVGFGVRLALETAGMFAVMCMLWGVWTSPSLADFGALLSAATFRGIDLLAIAGTLAAVAVAAFVANRLSLDVPAGLGSRRWWQQSFAIGLVPLASVWVLGHWALAGRLPPLLREVGLEARSAGLNAQDAERLQQGYYEQLTGVNRFNGQLWEVYVQAESPVGVPLDGLRPADERLRPLTVMAFPGGTLSTNRWGMRDRDYELRPPPDTVRVAVLGQSYVMGWGVGDGEPFEAQVEDRLNAERRALGLRYELLNFAMPNYSLFQQALIMEGGRVSGFSPDVILVVGHGSDLVNLAPYLLKELQSGRPLDPMLARWATDAGIDPGMSRPEVQRRLRPYFPVMGRYALDRIKAEADRLHARPVYALIPQPLDEPESEERAALFGAATNSGFTVINMEDVFEPFDEWSLVLNRADHHPNAEGHRIIADRLYRELIDHAIVP
jgi:D-alanyl-lipoteichoic acid acyltransferase DltB (MBOAT superfamily)